MIEDEQVADFLRGNELVFTTGIGHPDGMWLSDFAQGLIRNKASGLVVNIGPYIDAVPEQVIAYCKCNEFPLFTIPWHIRLVDITRDFCRRIISSEQAELSVSSAFKNAIFFPDDFSSIISRGTFSTSVLVWLAVGGRGNLTGAMVGAFLINWGNFGVRPHYLH